MFSRTCIDFIITNLPEARIDAVGVLYAVISDHYPIFMCVKKKRNAAVFCKIKGRTYKNYDKPLLQTLLTGDDWNNYYDHTDPEELWNILYGTINKHLNIMCPIKYIRLRKNSPPWITQEIVEAINDRNKFSKMAHQDPTIENLSTARTHRNRVNRLIVNSKTTYIKDTLNNNRDNQKKFWRILNETLLKGNNANPNVVFKQNDGTYTDEKASCEFMNTHLANVGVNLSSQFGTVMCNENYNTIYNHNHDDDDDVVFTNNDVLRVVKNIDVHKGSGIDFLPTFILKDCFEVLIDHLTYLFNQSMSLSVFPACWKLATITPIPKAGDCANVSNWRPISIIPLIGKMMEHLCVKLLSRYLEVNNILCTEQYGFRKNRSTSLAIFNYVKYIIDEMNRKKVVGCIYLDFARAFDSINHKRLILKLYDMGVTPKLCLWIENYLGNRQIRTKLNNSISSPKELVCGVPQGSIIGPTLFLCYINDLAITIRDVGTFISLYADDAVIYCSNNDLFLINNMLEQSLSVVHDWCMSNFININIQKIKYCIYGLRSTLNQNRVTQLRLGDQCISICHQYNYLGVHLDECLNIKSNYNSIFKKYSYKVFQFGKIKKFIDKKTRILVYKQTILPLVEYVSFMLYLNRKCEVDKLQRLQNRCLRMCLDIQHPRDMSVALLHKNARIDMLEVRRSYHLFKLMYNFVQVNKYKKDGVRITRTVNTYVFDTQIVHLSIYANSPYYVGVCHWNELPNDIRTIRDKHIFYRLLLAYLT